MKTIKILFSLVLLLPLATLAQNDVELKQQFAQSREFMIANATRDRVKAYKNGIQYIPLEAGTGPVLGPKDSVRLDYTITSVHGYVKEPRVSHFIKGRALRSGWKALIKGQKEGTKLRIFVPPDPNFLNLTSDQRRQAADVKIVEADVVKVYPAKE